MVSKLISPFCHATMILGMLRGKIRHKTKNQIKKLIQEELITRYQYREGLYQFYTKENLEIEKAIALLNNQNQYKSILKK